MPTCAVKQPSTRAVSSVCVQPQWSITTLGAMSMTAAPSSAPIAMTRATSRTFSGTSGSPSSGTRGSVCWLRHHSQPTTNGDRM